MKFLRFAFPAAMLSLAAANAQTPAVQTSESFEGEVTLKVGYRYLLSLPRGYEADTAKSWPLIIFLHGRGERGVDLEILKKHGPPKLLAAGKDLGAIVASLQCDGDKIWNPHGVKAVTDHLASTLRVDRDRIYLTGLSMGGFGTWETAFEYPDTYAAIAPVCGGAGVRWILVDRLKHLPAWIFHGGADSVVPVENSIKIHDALKKAGAPVKLTIYPGVGHDSWTAAYDDPEFWGWFLAQKKGA